MQQIAQARFAHELEVFRVEAEAVAQYFYAYLAVHAVAGAEPTVYRALNSAALFWNTSLSALQVSTFVALGRIFDQTSRHNVDRLLGIAQQHAEIFSKAALAARKQGSEPTAPPWLDNYLKKAYVPTTRDFRRLRLYVKKHRRVYETKYRDLRHKIFAHKELSDPSEIDGLFAKTNIRELQRMIVFLTALYEALWQLFMNGRKPTLRPQRYSVKAMRAKRPPKGRQLPVQERIVSEIEDFLVAAVSGRRAP